MIFFINFNYFFIYLNSINYIYNLQKKNCRTNCSSSFLYQKNRFILRLSLHNPHWQSCSKPADIYRWQVYGAPFFAPCNVLRREIHTAIYLQYSTLRLYYDCYNRLGGSCSFQQLKQLC